MLVLTESEIRRLVPLDLETVEAVEAGFQALGLGGVTTPPILRLDVPDAPGELDVKTAHARGWDSFAVKLSTGFFNNPTRGLCSANGLMLLLSAETGLPLAVLLDGGYLTTVRTAAAGALVAKHLAPPSAASVGLVGAGLQARWQVLGLRLVRPIQHIRVWARRREAAEGLARDLTAELGVEAEAMSHLEPIVRMSDIVVTATPSRHPLVHGAWLRPGQHVTAMGTDSPAKQELAADVFSRADLVVADMASQCLSLGDSRHAVAQGTLDPARLVELGAIVAGARSGRTSASQITVADLTGTGIQDTAIARLAYRRAVASGAGLYLDGGALAGQATS